MFRELERGRGIVIADTHFDIPSQKNQIGTWVEKQVKLIRSCDWAMMLGDTNELLHVPARRRLSYLDRIIKSEVGDVHRELKKIYTIQFDGNHDPLAIYLHYSRPYWKELASRMSFSYGGQEYDAFHGHVYDKYGFLDPIVGFLGKPFDPLIKFMDHYLVPAGKHHDQPDTLYAKWTEQSLRVIRKNLRPGAVGLIGHFHTLIDDRQVKSHGLTKPGRLSYILFDHGEARIVVDQY